MDQSRIVHRVINPLLRSLPDWMKGYRDHQVTAIEQVVDAFDRGVQVVLLDAPTGSGKTLIGESVRRILGMRASYVSSSKSLQDQFLHDYPYAKVLKGRSNYPTMMTERYMPSKPWSPDHLSAEDCTWGGPEDPCDWCWRKSSCPYEMAKNGALSADVAVLNTAYWLNEVNHIGKFAAGKVDDKDERRLVVFDEADTLERMLMEFVSVEIGQRRMERLGLYPPEKVTVPSSWKDWLHETIPVLEQTRRALPQQGNDVTVERERKWLSRTIDGLILVRQGLEEEDNAWVYTGQGGEGRGRSEAKGNAGRAVAYKPARVDRFGPGNIWTHGSRFLLMSATLISSDELLDSLGGRGLRAETVTVRNTFPVENRRVRVLPVVDMARKHGPGNVDTMAIVIAKDLIHRHENDRILIHTVSYDLMRTVEQAVRRYRPTISYEGASGRSEALTRFLATERAILVAPSMDRGIDLPGDACRVQIIAKVPFPYLGDRQTAARLHSRGGQQWYTVQTIRSLVQMCGRAVRSEDDWAVTYVLDRQFGEGVWSRDRGLFPSWFREALVWEREIPKITHKEEERF